MQTSNLSKWSVVEILGKHVRVLDSFERAMRLQAMLSDEEVLKWCEPDDITLAIMAIVLPEPERFCQAFGDDTGDALIELLWRCFGLDLKGDKPHEKPVMDWKDDEARIKATALATYGLTWDNFGELPYMDACKLIGLSPEDSPMGQALYYRTAKRPKRTKYNAEEVAAFDKAKEFYRLKGNGTKQEVTQAANARASAAFDALKKRSTHG